MGILDNAQVPDYVREGFNRAGFQARQVDDAVSVFSGHEGGVAFRFFRYDVYNKEKSKALKKEIVDSYDMIEWLVDARTKPTERVHFLPETLLAFEEETEEILKPNGDVLRDKDGLVKTRVVRRIPVGGKYLESYQRYLQGLDSPGLSLSRWDALDSASVVALAANGVFTVEQFASKPRNWVASKFSPEVMEAFERAIFYVNGKETREHDAKVADDMVKLAAENSKLADQIEQQKLQMKMMQDQMAALLQQESKPAEKKK